MCSHIRGFHEEINKIIVKCTLYLFHCYYMYIYISSKLIESDERNVRLANEMEELRDKYTKVVDKQQIMECKFTGIHNNKK